MQMLDVLILISEMLIGFISFGRPRAGGLGSKPSETVAFQTGTAAGNKN